MGSRRLTDRTRKTRRGLAKPAKGEIPLAFRFALDRSDAVGFENDAHLRFVGALRSRAHSDADAAPTPPDTYPEAEARPGFVVAPNLADSPIRGSGGHRRRIAKRHPYLFPRKTDGNLARSDFGLLLLGRPRIGRWIVFDPGGGRRCTG